MSDALTVGATTLDPLAQWAATTASIPGCLWC